MVCQCGKEVNTELNYCPYCGINISNPEENNKLSRLIPGQYANQLKSLGSNLTSERRIVTIMFVDIVGSTSLSESRDPEEVIDIINSAFKIICRPIQNHDGTIARFMGDGLLCFFGAPESHEDDPVRACSAALDIISGICSYSKTLINKFGVDDFSVRIGINTDLVVVGEVGTDFRVEYTAMGDGVNIAARLEQKAEPNSVLISDKTKKFIESKFSVSSLGDIAIKGKSKQVEAFKLLGIKDNYQSMVAEQNEPMLIGRTDEINQINSLIRDNNSGFLSIVGDAGIGKTRILDEIYINTPPQSKIISISCESYYSKYDGQLVKDIFRELFGIENVDHNNLSNSVNEFLEIMKTSQKSNLQLLLVDDFHKADDFSQDFIKELSLQNSLDNLFVLLSYRNENDAIRKFTASLDESNLPNYKKIHILPLNNLEVESLFNDLSANYMLPPKIKTAICENSGGNPFYVKVLIQSVLDSLIKNSVDDKNSLVGYHVDTIKIPRSLQGAVMARLDQLEPTARLILKYASVMGNTIDINLLREVLKSKISRDDFNKQLSEISNSGYLSAKSDSTNLKFTNSLVAESIYKSLLRTQRVELKEELDKIKQSNI